MLVIRLQRTGRRNAPAYRIVVAEKSRPVQGKYLEILGHYLPTREPVEFECNTEASEAWIKKGAQPSDTVARLLKKAGVKDLDKFISSYTKKRKRNAPEEVALPPPPAPTTEQKSEDKETGKEEVTKEPVTETPEEKPEVAEEPKAEEAKDTPAEDKNDEESKKEGDS